MDFAGKVNIAGAGVSLANRIIPSQTQPNLQISCYMSLGES